MRQFLILSMLAMLPLQADWVYLDENEQRHSMKGDNPNPYAEDACCVVEDPANPHNPPGPFPWDPPFPGDDWPFIMCGVFYVSTDVPNEWIEVTDEEIGLEPPEEPTPEWIQKMIEETA